MMCLQRAAALGAVGVLLITVGSDAVADIAHTAIGVPDKRLQYVAGDELVKSCIGRQI
jgi:hypothetical protein